MAEVERWTGSLACSLQSATAMTNEGFAAWLGIAVRTVAYWHSRPESMPGHASQQILTAALERISGSARERFSRIIAGSVSPERMPGTGNAVADTVTFAAENVSSDPLLSEGSFAHGSVESLQEEMVLLARSGGMTAFDVFNTARRLRDEARALAERTHRPNVLADLYVVIGQATSLMASTAFDLGHWTESAALARAATQYADLAGHASLKAWTYGLRMTLANWRNEPDAALAYFVRGMQEAPDGEPKLRLRHIAARSHALLGQLTSVARVLHAAQRDRDDAKEHPDELSTAVGGEFAFGDGRAAACAAAAWLDLANGEEAAKHARLALAAYEALPAARRPYSQVNGAQIDIAAAHLHTRDREGAQDALRGVLELPPHKRNVSLAGRLTKVQHLLATPSWRNDPEARQIAERVSTWLAETSARPLA